MRLFLHAGAYWMLWTLRSLAPKRSRWRTLQLDTLRLRLIKLAARVREHAGRIVLRLPSACPDQAVLRLLGERMARLVPP